MKSKLVRDKVPAQAQARGVTKVVSVRRLDHLEYVAALARKLVEEAKEFEASLSMEELADVYEVLLTLARTLASVEFLKKVRKVKRRIRGGFDGRTYMTWEEESQ